MGDSQRTSPAERDIEQAVTALKKGATLLKYGRRGKPKFCPFRISNDETALVWFSGKEERQLKLSQVSRIIPGQRTATFQRYPRPEKEYQSFSLICADRSLDLICKDKEEAEVWFVGLKALISNGSWKKWRGQIKENIATIDSPDARNIYPPYASPDQGDISPSDSPFETNPQTGLGKAFSDIILYAAASKNYGHAVPLNGSSSLPSPNSADNPNGRSSGSDNLRVSLSSAVSSSSSCHDDFDTLADCFIWGEGIGGGILGGSELRVGSLTSNKMDALLPKALESTVVLDVHYIACGGRHAALISKQGDVFSWGEESGGRLGHGVEVDCAHPKLIDVLTGMNVEMIACGEYHTCAVTLTGDLYTWGDGTRNSGLLGHGSEASHWIPKRVCGPMDSLHVSYVSCGPWHTAIITSSGQLFTFGDGTFGALGHGDRSSCRIPREVEALKGARTIRVACGGWHTAAIVETLGSDGSSGDCIDKIFTGKLFSWGDGDKGQLGHIDKGGRLVPGCIESLEHLSFVRVACGRDFTLGLTVSGQVYTMGGSSYGQLGCPDADGKTPSCVGGNLAYSFVEEVACGSHHVAVLTSKFEVYTWGKGTNGQLGHGDIDNKKEPTFVDFFKDKQVKRVACGTNFTAAICLHKWVSGADHTTCSGCHNPFNFRRKRHNCYNCGLVFCKACSSRKAVKAALAPNMSKPYRVCDDCYLKLKKNMESGLASKIPRPVSKNNTLRKSSESFEKETPASKLVVQITKLPFLDSLKKFEAGLSKSAEKEMKIEINTPHMYNEYCYDPSPPISYAGASDKRISASAPGSRMVSRASSPISQRTSPVGSLPMPSLSMPLSPELAAVDPKYVNGDCSQEIMDLRIQVEKLVYRNQFLESELQKTSKQLQEANAAATDEADKSKAANEIIESLNAQLKEMAEIEEQGRDSDAGTTSHTIANSNASTHSSITAVVSPRSESHIRTTNSSMLSNGNKPPQVEKSEWVVQDEAGVYITLCSSPSGDVELKRVRFSRKRFTEEQAEKWWAEHGTKVCERHNVRNQ